MVFGVGSATASQFTADDIVGPVEVVNTQRELDQRQESRRMGRRFEKCHRSTGGHRSLALDSQSTPVTYLGDEGSFRYDAAGRLRRADLTIDNRRVTAYLDTQGNVVWLAEISETGLPDPESAPVAAVIAHDQLVLDPFEAFSADHPCRELRAWDDAFDRDQQVDLKLFEDVLRNVVFPKFDLRLGALLGRGSWPPHRESAIGVAAVGGVEVLIQRTARFASIHDQLDAAFFGPEATGEIPQQFKVSEWTAPLDQCPEVARAIIDVERVVPGTPDSPEAQIYVEDVATCEIVFPEGWKEDPWEPDHGPVFRACGKLFAAARSCHDRGMGESRDLGPDIPASNQGLPE